MCTCDDYGDKIDIVDLYDCHALLEMVCSEYSQVYVSLKKSSITQMDLPPQPTPKIPRQKDTKYDSEEPKFIKIIYNLLNGTKFTRYFDTRYFDKYNMSSYLRNDLKQLHSHKLRYYWIDGEKAKESDHVHQSFLTHLYDMMNNLVKDFGKVEETAAGTTKIPTANVNQDSNCKITLGSTTYTGGQNVYEISVKEAIIEDKVIHETLATKESDSMTIDCEQKEKTTTGDGTSNNRTDSVTTNTKIPEKTIDHDLILKPLDEAANVAIQRVQEKSSEIANKVIHEALSGEVVEGSVEVVTHRSATNLREPGNTTHQGNDTLKYMNVLNTATHSSKSTENNGEPKKKITKMNATKEFQNPF
ncbi:uncharacterized protein isoform X4 [Musca autumnalis]|uniref:uncharacterized protein isoform X4 n=1 Tax=Musca autumnalis TaxID=221902 RepID=UPI003CF2EC17